MKKRENNKDSLFENGTKNKRKAIECTFSVFAFFFFLCQREKEGERASDKSEREIKMSPVLICKMPKKYELTIKKTK